jgi:hypothetical protein
MPKITDLPEATELADDDLLLAVDVSQTASKKIKKSNLNVGAPNADVGGLLWQWNRADTSQFESSAVFFDDATIEGTLGLSVVNVGNPFGNVLRLAYTAFRRGGGFFPIAASELTLPEQYVLYIRWGDQVPQSGFPRRGIVSLCWNDDGGTMNAMLVERNADSTQSLVTAVAGDTFQSTRGFATSSTYQINGNGIEQWWAVTRPNGAASAYARAWLRDRGGAANTMSFDSEDDLQTIGGVGTNWDNVDFTGLPGIGAEGQTLTAETGSCDIADLRIYAYPE